MRTHARNFRTLIFIFAALCVWLSLLAKYKVHAAERIMMGTPSRGLFEMPAVVAIQKGFFADEGLEVVKIQIQPQIGVKALIAGDVDYTLSWGSTLRAAATGVPLKVVAALASRPLHVLITRQEIRSGKDLKNRTVGVDSYAGTVDYLTRVAARHYGLEPEKDIKIIVTGPSPLRLAALKAGSIDATAIDVAYAVKAEEEGYRRLLYLGDIIELPLSGIGLTDRKLAEQREQAKKVIRAVLRGTAFMKKSRGETLEIMTRYLGITSAQAAKTYDTSISAFTEDGFVSEKGLALDIQLAKDRLKLTKEIPFSQVVDWSLLKEIQGEKTK